MAGLKLGSMNCAARHQINTTHTTQQTQFNLNEETGREERACLIIFNLLQIEFMKGIMRVSMPELRPD